MLAAALLLGLAAAPAPARDPGTVAGRAGAAVPGLAVADAALVVAPASPDLSDACALTITGRDGQATPQPCASEEAIHPAGAAHEANRPTAAAAAPPPLAFTPRHLIETPQSWGPYVAFDGPVPGAVLRIHGWGDVAAMTADGDTLWTRGSMSFHDDWGVPVSRVPFARFGASPGNPFLPVTERPYAVGDVTRDGIEDVVVAHSVAPPEGPDVSAVTVLDGATGTTLWMRLFAGWVSQVHLDGGRLILAEEGAGGATSVLHALDLAAVAGGVEAENAWTFDSGGAGARWLALEPFGAGRVAVALTAKPLGAPGDAGRLLALPVHGDGAGAPDWEVTTDGYPRFLRADPASGTLVAHLQTDPQTGWSYALAAFDADGAEVARVVREEALLVALAVGDVTGDGHAEWVVGDAEIDEGGIITAGRVTVTDPATGGDLWTHRTDAHSPDGLLLTYGLLPVDGGVAAASRTFAPTESFSNPFAFAGGALVEGLPDLRLLDGGTGEPRWTHRGGVFPLFLAAGEAGILGGTENHRLRRFATADGALLADAPLLSRVNDVDVVERPDGRRDLIVGAGSGAVFALPADGLGPVPEVAWRAVLNGPVRTVEVVDVTGDGTPEVVVAATDAVAVLDALDGTLLTHIGIDDGFVWTVTAADLSAVPDFPAGGAAELVVPTRTLAAYGLDGELWWEYAPAQALEVADAQTYFSNAVVSGGHVLAQASIDPPTTFAGSRTVQLFMAVEGWGGAVAWQHMHAFPALIPRFWHSAVVLPGESPDGGDAVGFVYQHTVFSPGASWRHAAVVYDVDSGQRLWQQGPSPFGNVAHVGAFERHGELYQADSATLTRHRSGGIDQVGLPVSAVNLGWVDLGELGEALAYSALFSVGFYPAEIAWGDPADHLAPPQRWSSPVLLGDFLVVHLDDGTVPQVVAHRADYEAYATVARFEGVGVSLSSFAPEALVVLDISDGGP